MTGRRLSIALCTYNGEAYLAEQLGSIAAQRRLPDELIVCDDRSNDGTLGILDAFARNSSFPVHIHENAANVGSNKNFEKAILLCTGDIIALADQDDFWLPEKLSRIADAFDGNPHAGVVFSNAAVVDRNLNPLGITLWERFEFTRKRKRQFDSGNAWRVLLDRQMVTGATMAFRKGFTDKIVPFPSSWIHDAWIAFIMSLCAEMVYIDEPLVQYREHPGQQLGARRKKAVLTARAVFGDNSGLYVREFRRYSQGHRRLKKLRSTLPDYDGKIKAIRDRVVYYYSRSHMPKEKRKRVFAVAANLCSLRYHRYSNGFLSAAKDLFLN